MIHIYRGGLPSIVNNHDKMEITQITNDKGWTGNEGTYLG